jgi:hypothetical protein
MSDYQDKEYYGEEGGNEHLDLADDNYQSDTLVEEEDPFAEDATLDEEDDPFAEDGILDLPRNSPRKRAKQSKAPFPPQTIEKVSSGKEHVYLWTEEHNNDFQYWWKKTKWARKNEQTEEQFRWHSPNPERQREKSRQGAKGTKASPVWSWYHLGAVIDIQKEGQPVMVCKLSTCRTVLSHPDILVKQPGVVSPGGNGTSAMLKHLKSTTHMKNEEAAGIQGGSKYCQTQIKTNPGAVQV